MTEELQPVFDEAKQHMDAAIDHLGVALNKIRAGKAHPSMLSTVMVDYYGSHTPLQQVANVNTMDPRTLSVQPWEKAMLDPICTAITNSNLGLNPMNNGEIILINVPALTEERRQSLTKQARAEAEHAKVSIRNARKEANDYIKMMEKDGLSEDMSKTAVSKVQDMTDKYVTKVDAIIADKESDIMTV